MGRELRRGVNKMVDGPAFARDFKLADQMRQAARSVCSNIAEGFGKRSHAEFARFVDISIGSAWEIQNHLTECADRALADPTDVAVLDDLARRIAAAATGLSIYLRRTPTPSVQPKKRASNPP